MQFSDFASPQFYANPYPFYNKVRAEGALVPLAPGISIAGHHDMVNAILCDRKAGRAYLKGVTLRYGAETAQGETFQLWNRMLLMMNPPSHTPIRAALMQAFNARQIEELQKITLDVANELIDEFIADQQANLLTQFALPLPMKIICRLLNIAYDDAELFVHAARLLMQTLELNPMSAEQIGHANQAAIDIQEYFALVLDERKSRPGNDLISRLLQADVEGQHLSDEDIIANVIMLFLAGHETTASMIGNALIALHRHPEQWAALANNPDLAKTAALELLRYDSSVQLSVRVTLEDMDVLGHSLKAGHIIYLLTGSANRDPAVFNEPDTLNFDRPAHEARAVTFGGGVHYCMGARLAQMELETALNQLFKRLPHLAIEEPKLEDWHQRHTLRGVTRLQAYWKGALSTDPQTGKASDTMMEQEFEAN